MAPAKGCARVDAAKFGGLQQASAFDHRLGMVEPTVLLSQPRHRRLGERIESAPKALAAKPRRTVGLPQATISPPAQCGQPWAFTRSWAVPSASERKPRFGASDCEALGAEPDAVSFRKTPSSPSSTFARTAKAYRRCPALSRLIPRSQSENSLTSIRALPACQLQIEIPRTNG